MQILLSWAYQPSLTFPDLYYATTMWTCREYGRECKTLNGSSQNRVCGSLLDVLSATRPTTITTNVPESVLIKISSFVRVGGGLVCQSTSSGDSFVTLHHCGLWERNGSRQTVTVLVTLPNRIYPSKWHAGTAEHQLTSRSGRKVQPSNAVSHFRLLNLFPNFSLFSNSLSWCLYFGDAMYVFAQDF